MLAAMTEPELDLITGATATEIADSVERAVRRPGSARATGCRPSASSACGSGSARPRWRPPTHGCGPGGGHGQGRGGTAVAERPPLPVAGPPAFPPGTRDLTHGGPDPALLPPLDPALALVDRRPTCTARTRSCPSWPPWPAPSWRPTASRWPAGRRGLDGVERILQAHLRPGDRVAVDDPGFPPALDLIRALGLRPEPVPLDDDGPLPEGLAEALAAGCGAVLTTLRAQNPTGAVASPARLAELRRVLDAHPEVVVVEDDHAGPVAGAPGVTLRGPAARLGARPLGVQVARPRPAPGRADRRPADRGPGPGPPAGRHRLGQPPAPGAGRGHVVGPGGAALERGRETYRRRREALASALAARASPHARSGLNVWVPGRGGRGQPAAARRRLGRPGRRAVPAAAASPRSALPCPCSMSTTPRDLADDIEAAMAPRRRTRLA